MIFEKFYKTRFAPSPTGNLHIGHAYSALFSWYASGKKISNFSLRIEDIDFNRCKKIYVESIIEDLKWLGIKWKPPIVFQSLRQKKYQNALEKLKTEKFIYPCYLNRKEINEILSAPHYTKKVFRNLKKYENKIHHKQNPAWRIDINKVSKKLGKIYWKDYFGNNHPIDYNLIEDVVIARKDISTSYHLSSVVDDAEAEISLVVRGQDLIQAAAVHTVVQKLLEIPSPIYLHHPLLKDKKGRKLSKRDQVISILELRSSGIKINDLFDQMPKFEMC